MTMEHSSICTRRSQIYANKPKNKLEFVIVNVFIYPHGICSINANAGHFRLSNPTRGDTVNIKLGCG